MLSRIRTEGSRFVDDSGRHVILRGVNLGGDCKVPFKPNGHSYLPTDFSDHRTVSFVGRPAPLDELDSHLARIAHWGFNCLRLLTTWEAVEHAGPGRYDDAYLDYYAEVCRRAGQYGLYVFVDFHQDVWARMSGGDGAPGWTFEAAGLDFTRFDAADGAHVMQYRYDHRVGGRQVRYPVMSWGGNYRMPATGIMWTLFFAGEDFAPGCTVNGVNIQRYLQDHYLGSMAAVAERVADLDNVMGFDTLNEPGSGWIGQRLDRRGGLLRGAAWSPLDGLASASGMARTLPLLEGGETVMNASCTSIWMDGREDPFRSAGAWDVDASGDAVALRNDFFANVAGRGVDIERDYRLPFFGRVAETIRALRDDWLVFAETDPFGAMRGEGFPYEMPERTVNASHWYDLSALVTKRFDPARSVNILTGAVHEGPQAIEDDYARSLERVRAAGDGLPSGAPTLIGECGIAYDMNDAQAYAAWSRGDRDPSIWDAQTTALDLMYNAFDRLLLSSTQWNYTVSNRNDAMVGDGWNQEDLSIWSADQVTGSEDPDSGGRAIEGFCRVVVRATQGRLLSQKWDRAGRRFSCEVNIDKSVGSASEIFIPITRNEQIRLLIDGIPAAAKPYRRLISLNDLPNGSHRIELKFESARVAST